MNVWVRVFPTINGGDEGRDRSTLTLAAELSLVVYPTEVAARAAVKDAGGIVLEVNAASLREISERGITKEGNDVFLGREEEAKDEPAPTSAYVAVVFPSLPHQWVGETEVDRVEFSPEAKEWLAALEEATGLVLMDSEEPMGFVFPGLEKPN